MLYKYPRTPHLPWSPGKTNDDRVLKDLDCFSGKEIIMSLKMDGENTTMYPDHIHARSLDSQDHESRHYVKGLHAQIKHMIPADWRVCGENLYAKHSIHYKGLDAYFEVYSVWDEDNYCLSYDDTIYFCNELGLTHVPVLWSTYWEDNPIKMEALLTSRFFLPVGGPSYYGPDNNEGYVIRNAARFSFDDFERNVAKYVRENHVQTDKHWMTEKVIPNLLRE